MTRPSSAVGLSPDEERLLDNADLLGFLQQLNPMSFAVAAQRALAQEESTTDENLDLVKSGAVTEADLRPLPKGGGSWQG
eukprot:6342380-Amphidinium_carterae.4